MYPIIQVAQSLLLMALAFYSVRAFLAARNGRMEITLLFVASLCFYYGAGTFLGLVIAPSDISKVMLADAGLDQRDLIWPLSLVTIYAVFAVFLGWGFRALSFGREQIVVAIESVMAKKANLLLYSVLLAAQGYLLVTGKVAFGGVQTDEVNVTRVSPLALLVAPFSYASLIVAGYMMLNLRAGSFNRYFFRCMLVVQLAYIILGGRRMAAIAFSLAFLGLYISGVRRKRLVLVSSIFTVLFAVAFSVFFAMRVAGFSSEVKGLSRFNSLKAQLSGVKNVTNETATGSSFIDELRLNASTRPFIIGYFAMLCKGQGTGSHGEVLMGSVATAIPHLLWSDKDAWRADEELIAYRTFGLPRLQDEANTVITSGYTDWVLIGPILFIILVFTFVGFGSLASRKLCSPEATLIIFSSVFTNCLNLEADFAAWFVAFRDIAILSVLCYFWSRAINQPKTGFPRMRLSFKNSRSRPNTGHSGF